MKSVRIYILAIVLSMMALSGCGTNREDVDQSEVEMVSSAGAVGTEDAETNRNTESEKNEQEVVKQKTGKSEPSAPLVETTTPMDIEAAWEVLRKAYFEFSELNEMSYDEAENLNVVTWQGVMPFSEGDEERPCETIVFYDHTDGSSYVFGCWTVFYEGDEVYATRTEGWYFVNMYTGEVTGM